jgi:hypothetical protein
VPSAHERLEELEQRVAAMEQRLGTEAGLRASGDRDLADVAQAQRAMRHLVQAVSITQSEHTQTLLDHTELLRGHSSALRTANEKLDQIVTMLTALLERP